jgi:hypothetical protein
MAVEAFCAAPPPASGAELLHAGLSSIGLSGRVVLAISWPLSPMPEREGKGKGDERACQGGQNLGLNNEIVHEHCQAAAKRSCLTRLRILLRLPALLVSVSFVQQLSRISAPCNLSLPSVL